MIKKVMLLLCGAAVPFISVSQTTDSLFSVKINTRIMLSTAKMYLMYRQDGKKMVDSAIQNNGLFIFKGKIERPLKAMLMSDTTNFGFSGVLKKRYNNPDILQLYIYPGQVVLETSSHSIAEAKLVGKGVNSDYFKLRQMFDPLNEEIDRVIKLRRTTDKANRVLLNKKSDSLSRIKKAIQRKFIIENPDNFIALEELWNYAGIKPDIAVIEPMFNKLSASVRNMQSGKEFQKFLSNQEGLNPGAMAPAFVQNDTAGNPVNLASFKGKYVLIDFWASWCGPCRKTNPELVKIYNEFKGRNFTILGISLDSADGKDAWLKAIKDDKLSWTHVSDLKYWKNKVAKLYSIGRIPQSFLIDPEGLIIARDLKMNELVVKLKQVLPVK